MSSPDEDGLDGWLAGMRPRLHSFCGRMMGSAFDGEDVVQEAMARAASAYAGAAPIANAEAWLFRIARNAAIDALRQRRAGTEEWSGNEADPQSNSASRAEVTLGFTAFLPLAPPQRASVVLVDVLGYSLAETATILETSVPAVKASLHRGRARLAAQSETLPINEGERMRLQAYADLFNAREFEALRDLLAADVRLDLPARTSLRGKSDVSVYFERYASTAIRWRLQPIVAEGRLGLLAEDRDDPANRSLILVDWVSGRIGSIRDFLYARYVLDGVSIATL